MQSGKPSFGCSLAQHGAGVGIPFDGEDGFMPKDEIGEQAAAGSCEEMRGSHGSGIPFPKNRPDILDMRLQRP